jgi:hypothetical protein
MKVLMNRQVRTKPQALGTASTPIGVCHQHSAHDPVIAQAESGEHLPFAPTFSPGGRDLGTFTTNTIPFPTAQNRCPASGLPFVGAP